MMTKIVIVKWTESFEWFFYEQITLYWAQISIASKFLIFSVEKKCQYIIGKNCWKIGLPKLKLLLAIHQKWRETFARPKLNNKSERSRNGHELGAMMVTA